MSRALDFLAGKFDMNHNSHALRFSHVTGRAKHFLNVTDPRNVFIRPAQLDAAKHLVEEAQKVDIGTGAWKTEESLEITNS